MKEGVEGWGSDSLQPPQPEVGRCHAEELAAIAGLGGYYTSEIHSVG